MEDTISRREVLDKFEPWLKVKDYNDGELNMLKAILYEIRFMRSAQPEPLKINIEDFNKEDWERLKKEWGNTPMTVLSAQPKRGRWISADAVFHGVPFYCSECGENTRDTVMGKPRWKFCPMCGAKMEGADDE